MENLITPIILAGGKGTRLWPMSRSARPKQFLSLTSDLSLFQQTLRRVSNTDMFAAPIVITNEEYRFLVAEQAQEAGIELAGVLLEPAARNTAPAIAAAASFAIAASPKAMLFVLPSDHELLEDDIYARAVSDAQSAANDGKLVTFGIEPTEPSSAYGYIASGEPVNETVKRVNRFVEKPDRENAESMLASGGYYWNSGMFMFAASTFLNECKALAPDVLAAAQKSVTLAQRDLDFVRLDKDAFSSAPDISVDYAIFEKTDRAVVVPAAINWSDLGSWDAVWKTSPKDASDNVTRGPATLSNAKGSLVVTETMHVAVQGLDDVVVVASEDAVYVGKLSEAQQVGALVKQLRADADTEKLTETHLTCYRPWGGYSSVLNGERFQVKRLFVKPGKKLSLQKHHHRSEHWIVVRGTAEVTIGDNVQTLRENQSVYIPQGDVHRLANPGKILLELIEVQTGSYLGEDDIIRIEDEFGRS